MFGKETIKRALKRLKPWVLGDTLQLLGRMASWQVRSHATISYLQDAEFKVSSQWVKTESSIGLLSALRFLPPRNRLLSLEWELTGKPILEFLCRIAIGADSSWTGANP